MVEGIGDLTALVTAVGVLAGAIGIAAVKIMKCINDLRVQQIRVQQQTTRMRLEAAGTGEVVQHNSELIKNDLNDISVKVEKLHYMFAERWATTDNRFNRIEDRLQHVEMGKK